MDFDTSMIAPLPPEGVCIEGVEYDLEQSPYGTADIQFDRNGRPVGTSLQEWIDELDIKLIEHYGESIRPKLNYARAERGMNPL